jgi:hypothetical protein
MVRFNRAVVAAASIASALACIAQVGSAPVATSGPGTALTIYSAARPGAISPDVYRMPGRGALPGYAVVRQERTLDFTRGRNNIRFSDIAGFIDPTTVVFESLTDAKGTTVVEQNFQFDLVSTEKLLQRYIDKTIGVDQVRGSGTESFSGTLLSAQGGLVLRNADRSVQVLPHNAGVKLPALPGGLITRPTLVWEEVRVRNQKTERVTVQVKENLHRWSNWTIAGNSHD